MERQVVLSQEEWDNIEELLRQMASRPEQIQLLMRNRGIVIKDHDDPMEKFAFTLYSEIVSLAAKARVILDEEIDDE